MVCYDTENLHQEPFARPHTPVRLNLFSCPVKINKINDKYEAEILAVTFILVVSITGQREMKSKQQWHEYGHNKKIIQN